MLSILLTSNKDTNGDYAAKAVPKANLIRTSPIKKRYKIRLFLFQMVQKQVISLVHPLVIDTVLPPMYSVDLAALVEGDMDYLVDCSVLSSRFPSCCRMLAFSHCPYLVWNDGPRKKHILI